MENNEIKKSVTLNGKYTIQKMSKQKQKREVVKKWDFTNNDYYSHDIQKQLINKLYNKNTDFEYSKELISELKSKLSGYKQQDRVKKMLNKEIFMCYERLIDLLEKSELLCFYCQKEVFLLYEHIRENNQWTLDRIDNNQGHNVDNVVICCLKCNLQKKLMNEKKFQFTKQMVINKCD